VLDSFAGSGTTGAVAHKMGRRWIMVELGEHCHTHIIPRLKKVIDGEDPGGVSALTTASSTRTSQHFSGPYRNSPARQAVCVNRGRKPLLPREARAQPRENDHWRLTHR